MSREKHNAKDPTARVLSEIKKAVESIAKNTEPKDHPGNSQPPTPHRVIVDRLNLPVEASAYYESQKRQEPPKIWQMVKPLIEVGSFIALVAYVIITGHTLDKVASQAVSSQAQVIIMQDQFATQQRAWLQPRIQIPKTPGTFPSIAKLTLLNVGKSPITQQITEAAFEVVDSQRAPSFGVLPRHMIDTQTLHFPNDDAPSPLRFTPAPEYEIRDFNPKDIADLLSGKGYVAIYGQSRYRDPFGWHWMNFCLWREYFSMHSAQYIEFTSRPCVDFNSFGDGTPEHWPFPQTPDDPKWNQR